MCGDQLVAVVAAAHNPRKSAKAAGTVSVHNNGTPAKTPKLFLPCLNSIGSVMAPEVVRAVSARVACPGGWKQH